MIGHWFLALLRWLRALLGLRAPHPRAFYPPQGPARPLHANSVEHGDQHGARPPAHPPGPPGPPGNAP